MTAPAHAPTEHQSQRYRASSSVDDHPFIAIWELTQACDLVCAHCRACATTRRSPEELSTSEGKALLDSIASMGTPLVVLTGGDPAKREDLVELVAHGTRVGLTMAVTPSGTPSTTVEVLRDLKRAGLARLAVSVDGPDAQTHDEFRGVVGSFDESVRILQVARELGLSTQVNTTIHPGNLKGLRAMGNFVADVGSVLWAVFVVVPTGRAGASLLFGPQALEGALEELAELAESAPFDVKTTAAPHFRRILMARHAKHAKLGLLRDVAPDGTLNGPRGVTDGVGFLFVSHTGDVYPSGFFPLSAGNVRSASVVDTYRHSPLFTTLRDADKLEGKCGICPFRRVCGGSRARAYAATGNAMGPDPLCAYEPRPIDASQAQLESDSATSRP